MSTERRPQLAGPLREAETGIGGLAATGVFALVCETTEGKEQKLLARDEICGMGDNVGLSPAETYLALGTVFAAFVIHGAGRLIIRIRQRNNQ